MNNIDNLRQCFRKALDLPAEAAVDNMQYAKLPVWDSVAHMRLIAEIERTFNIMFTTDQILDMSSFAKAKEIIGGHGVEV